MSSQFLLRSIGYVITYLLHLHLNENILKNSLFASIYFIASHKYRATEKNHAKYFLSIFYCDKLLLPPNETSSGFVRIVFWVFYQISQFELQSNIQKFYDEKIFQIKMVIKIRKRVAFVSKK